MGAVHLVGAPSAYSSWVHVKNPRMALMKRGRIITATEQVTNSCPNNLQSNIGFDS